MDQDALVAVCGRPRHAALDDPAAAVAAALVDPVEFPSLATAIVPGDRIAVALGVGVPSAAELVAGVVRALLEAGAAAEDISVLRPAEQTSPPDPRRLLPEAVQGQ
ncbi:MAG: hypothetical protein GTO03_02075, partial [Planctomycetales bacterium]|nr:hypothetical protein [Planctomycetales bacterium]